MLADTPLPRGFGAALASVDTFFPRAPEQFVTSPLCLVGYVRWDARSDRVPPLQTIIFSSFPGRTKECRLTGPVLRVAKVAHADANQAKPLVWSEAMQLRIVHRHCRAINPSADC